MSDRQSHVRTRVKLTDVAARVPGLLIDAPSIMRGAVTGLLPGPSPRRRSAPCSRTGPLASGTGFS
ncbi:acyl-CoA synthetase domain protein [Mycobacterium ulcerans str. Harvey]|uniref:Acyl-CoA synthetase domain protein n=1 Tax=Mycobacterium ulcerans str. Harvey TaxID=1299332 RepID=A0ABP3ALA4_MYCUL|nr:acyl-CoA synthetase domain protein [Mycobacterium ulcerans str. Harvey]